MKKLSRLFTAAFILFAAAACGTKEIDHPDNPDNPHIPDTPQDSEFTITASIVKTRVIYSDDETGGYLDQKWEAGDVLFGFINGSYDNKIAFKVNGDTDTVIDGVATLVAATGYENALASLKINDVVDLVYTGSVAAYDDEARTIKTVTMTGQTGSGKIPACMHSKATVVKEGSTKKLDFKFINDCAILEIESLTGVEELKLSSSKNLVSISISSFCPSITYGYKQGIEGLSIIDTGTIEDHTVTLGGPWAVTSEGVIKYGENTKPVLIAVAPLEDEEAEEIIVTADVADVDEENDPSFNYGKNTLQSGYCYVISKREVVARTADGRCFGTVKAAFDYAKEYLSIKEDYATADKNIVTLIKSIINGLGENVDKNEDGQYEDVIINIECPVTLDLNGCDLLLCCNDDYDPYDNNSFGGGFEVASGKDFIITDNTIAAGYIRSSSTKPIIDNYGSVTVNNGYLYHYLDNAVNNSSGTLSVYGGELYSWSAEAVENYTNGIVEIYDGVVDSDNSIAVVNHGILKIYGGEVCSINDHAIQSDGECVDIGNPVLSPSGHADIKINTTNDYFAIYCSAGGFNVHYGNVGGAVELTGSVKSGIYGGYFESYSPYGTLYLHDGPQCEISGGTICNAESDGDGYPAIWLYKNSSLKVTWPKDVREEANTDYYVTVEGNHEPLIYSCGSGKKSSPIRKAFGGIQEKETSSLEITGGYLISTNSAFYSQESGRQIGDPMAYNYFNNLFTNSPALFAASGSSDVLTPLDETHTTYPDYSAGNALGGFYFDAVSSSVPTGDLYKITGPAQTGSTDPYIFNDFKW